MTDENQKLWHDTAMNTSAVYRELVKACWALMDDVNERYPDKDPYTWQCPHFQRICDLTYYQPMRKIGGKEVAS